MTLVSIHGIVFYRGGTQWLYCFILLSMFLSFHLKVNRLQTNKASKAFFTFTLQCLSVPAKTLFTVLPECTRPAVKVHPGQFSLPFSSLCELS